MAILGRDIYVCVGSGSAAEIIAGTRNNEFQVSCDELEKSSPTSDDWKEFLAGRKEWSITTNFLMLTSSTVQSLLNVGNTYMLQIVSRSGSSASIELEGEAILTVCKFSATEDNLVQGSFQFRGNGALSVSV